MALVGINRIRVKPLVVSALRGHAADAKQYAQQAHDAEHLEIELSVGLDQSVWRWTPIPAEEKPTPLKL